MDMDMIEKEFRKHLSKKTQKELVDIVCENMSSSDMLNYMFEWEHPEKR